MNQLAYVHTNKDSTLKVIANLVKKEFYVPSNWSCLYNQFLYVAESLTGLNWRTFYNKKFRDKTEKKGHTPQQIVKFANKLSTGFKFNCAGIQNVDDAVEIACEGQPVIMVISNDNPLWKDTSDMWRDKIYPEDIKDRDVGECIRFSGDLKKPPSLGYHALLIIGYDYKYDFVIAREATADQGYRGYFKIKKKLLVSSPQSAAYFAFTVTKV